MLLTSEVSVRVAWAKRSVPARTAHDSRGHAALSPRYEYASFILSGDILQKMRLTSSITGI